MGEGAERVQREIVFIHCTYQHWHVKVFLAGEDVTAPLSMYRSKQ